MIPLLLFFQHKLAKRSKEFSFIKPDICLSVLYEGSKLIYVKEYVSSITRNYGEKSKNQLLINSSKTSQNHCKDQVLLGNEDILFLRGFDADIQCLTICEAIVLICYFLRPNASFFHSLGLWPSLFKTIRKCLFIGQAHEHFYRLRSLFEHEPQSYLWQNKRQKSGFNLENNIYANYPFKK